MPQGRASCGWNTVTAARSAAGARTSVAWPPSPRRARERARRRRRPRRAAPPRSGRRPSRRNTAPPVADRGGDLVRRASAPSRCARARGRRLRRTACTSRDRAPEQCATPPPRARRARRTACSAASSARSAVRDRRRDAFQAQRGQRRSGFGLDARRDAAPADAPRPRRRQTSPSRAPSPRAAAASSSPSTSSVCFGFGARQHLDGDVGHHRERAPGAGEQLAQVVAGDVLHHAPARLEGLAAAGDRREAEEMIARGAGLDAARAGEVRGERAADRAAPGRAAEQRAVIHRLERQLLVVGGEQRLDLGDRRAGPGREDQLLRLIERDAGEARQVEASGRIAPARPMPRFEPCPTISKRLVLARAPSWHGGLDVLGVAGLRRVSDIDR